MSVPPELLRMQAALKAGVVMQVGITAAVAKFALASDPTPFPALLDAITLVIDGGGSARVGLQLFLSDDDDVSDPTNLSGEPLWTWRGDVLAGEDPIPYQEYRKPVTWYPRRFIHQAGTVIKSRWHVNVIGNDYRLLFNLIPL